MNNPLILTIFGVNTNSVGKINFHYADRKPLLKNRRSIKDFIQKILFREGKQINTISYIFCSDDYLLSINKQFLKHDYFTDIITFDLSENAAITGEIYISVDRVKENAALNKVRFASEMLRVIIHGILHLCGYNDKKKSEKIEMRNKEDYYLHLFRP